MIKIALIGYGKMGRVIESIAPSLDGEIVSRIDPTKEDVEWKKITPSAIANADVCIDFSHPTTVLDTLKIIAPTQKPLVIGTTGWHDNLDGVKALVDKFQLGVIYAQNFSLGMSLYARIVEKAASQINDVGGYDVALNEVHHRQKEDSPSGTASVLANLLIQNTSHKSKITHQLADGKINPDELHVSSVRVGAVPGTHTVTFSSDQDTITLTHQAHDRTAWARGALEAAKWIKDRKGLFNINDMIEVLKCHNPE